MQTTSFSLQGQVLKLTTAEEIATHIEPLEHLENLTEIAFSGNTIGIEAGKALANALFKHSTLKKVIMSDMFTGRLKTEIPIILVALVEAFKNKPIEFLDLSDNAFGPAGANPLVPFLSGNDTLETLYLNNNGLGIGGANIISQALKGNQKLRTIIMGRNRMESEGAIALAKSLSTITSLRELRMPQNSIRPKGIEEILASLKNIPLEYLDLQDNTFIEVGCDALVAALDSWKDIRVLNIGECLLGAKGSIKIIKKLTGAFEKLEELCLSYNEIDETGAKFIPEMLKNKKNLKKLELNGNAFPADADVVDDIRDALSLNGFPDALDELDDMETLSDGEEEVSDNEKSDNEENIGNTDDELSSITKALKV